MSNKQITMLDIVKESGYSRRTISSVLNGKSQERGISSKTAHKILEYIEKRGYEPSRAALMLRGSSENSIGILYGGPLYSSKTLAFNEFIHQLRSSGKKYRMEIYLEAGNDISAGLKELVSRRVRNLVCFYNFIRANDNECNTLLALADQMEKVIIYDYNFFKDNDFYEKKFIDKGIYLIGMCRETAFEAIAQKLLELGHLKILMPETYEKTVVAMCFKKTGLECVYTTGHKEIKETQNIDLRDFALAVKACISEYDVHALYLHSDTFAALTIMELLNIGLKVPQDISVIGFANLPIGKSCKVPITTVNIKHPGMVEKTYDILTGKSMIMRNEFTPELICRESIGKYKAKTRSIYR